MASSRETGGHFHPPGASLPSCPVKHIVSFFGTETDGEIRGFAAKFSTVEDANAAMALLRKFGVDPVARHVPEGRVLFTFSFKNQTGSKKFMLHDIEDTRAHLFAEFRGNPAAWMGIEAVLDGVRSHYRFKDGYENVEITSVRV